MDLFLFLIFGLKTYLKIFYFFRTPLGHKKTIKNMYLYWPLLCVSQRFYFSELFLDKFSKPRSFI
ncbi:unnamed protein product [Meloidogyne enterolobii]|uniref:Uncharacterized protein n=1 Tax=Meloidogyne enterolobii TaxID=390850 RepID=A0ACB0Z525_MELEN